MVPARGESTVVQEMQNSGNEAKKSLKTKDITFSNAANSALFVCNSAPIARQKE
jgi:hypothetical protein